MIEECRLLAVMRKSDDLVLFRRSAFVVYVEGTKLDNWLPLLWNVEEKEVRVCLPWLRRQWFHVRRPWMGRWKQLEIHDRLSWPRS